MTLKKVSFHAWMNFFKSLIFLRIYILHFIGMVVAHYRSHLTYKPIRVQEARYKINTWDSSRCHVTDWSTSYVSIKTVDYIQKITKNYIYSLLFNKTKSTSKCRTKIYLEYLLVRQTANYGNHTMHTLEGHTS